MRLVAQDGSVLDALAQPRDSFSQMPPGTPWSALQLAYFVGYAMWMYLTLPFSLLTHRVACEEVAPWSEDGQTWRVLKAVFPPAYVTHSVEQALYFDAQGLLRRHDYTADVSGSVRVAHYLEGHRYVAGIPFATRRRVYLRGADHTPNKSTLIIAADLDHFELV